MGYQFDLDYVWTSMPDLLSGLLVTLQVSLISIALAIVIGIVGGSIRLLAVPGLSLLVRAYVELIRNTPILVQLFFIFYALPTLGLRLDLFWSGALTLTVWGGAYNVENVRAGLLAVARGLREAAEALGLSQLQYLRYVAVPLALRVSLPAMLNTSVSMLKNSSYLQTIGLAELTFVAVERVASDFRTLEMFAAICVIYVALVLVLSFAASRLERRLQQPFRA